MRLVAKLWHAYVHMPAVIEKYRGSDLALFSYSRDHGPDLERKYAEPLAAFRQNLQELADVLKEYTGDSSRVLFVFHPHLQHLKADASGRVWNDLVSSSVQKMAAANDFHFFNATEALKKRFGSRPENFYWTKDDMHFAFEGLAEYSAVVAAFMEQAVINPKDATRDP